MAKERLSQQTLMEVLTRKIESLEKASALVSKHYPDAVKHTDRMASHVEQIEQMMKTGKVGVDTTALSEAFDRHTETLEKRLKKTQIIPRWVMITLITIFSLLLISGIANYALWNRTVKAENQATYYYQKVLEFEGKK